MRRFPVLQLTTSACCAVFTYPRQDEVNGETVTTFDIRMKEPNREPGPWDKVLCILSEHLAATYCDN